jgi:hypothetical protein
MGSTSTGEAPVLYKGEASGIPQINAVGRSTVDSLRSPPTLAGPSQLPNESFLPNDEAMEAAFAAQAFQPCPEGTAEDQHIPDAVYNHLFELYWQVRFSRYPRKRELHRLAVCSQLVAHALLSGPCSSNACSLCTLSDPFQRHLCYCLHDGTHRSPRSYSTSRPVHS